MTKEECIKLGYAWCDEIRRKHLTIEQRKAIYGEEECENFQNRQKGYYEKWCKCNTEKVKERNKHNNKSVIVEQRGQSVYDEKQNKKRMNNQQNGQKYLATYKTNNPQRYRASCLKHQYTRKDTENGLETNLTIDFIVENFNNGCDYCGEKDFNKLGLDRIDNKKGHTMDNVVCACTKCNVERGNEPRILFKYRKQHPQLTDSNYEKMIELYESYLKTA